MSYLYTKDNPNAPKRANGKRGWFYPERKGGLGAIRLIGVHTAETAPSTLSAENVANYLRTGAAVPASYHTIHDNDSDIRLLPDEATAFGIKSFNTPTLHQSFATYAKSWGKNPVWDRDAIVRGARQAAEWVDKYDIPIRWLSRSEALSQKGFIRHSIADPSRRSDPGSKFLHTFYFATIKEFLEDEMTEEEKKVLGRIPEIERKLDLVITRLGSRYRPGSQGGDEQLSVGSDLERVRKGINTVLGGNSEKEC